MRMKRHHLTRSHQLFLIITLCLFVGLMGARAAAEQRIDNGGAPDQGERKVALIERWRIESDDELLLGVVRDAVQDAEGNTYLVDEQLAQIAVIAPDGSVVQIMGREGEGPGEFQWPGCLLWLPAPTLGVIDARRGEISRLSLAGLPQKSWLMLDAKGQPLRSAAIAEASQRGGTLALVFRESINEAGEFKNASTLALASMDGHVAQRLLTQPRGWDFARKQYIERDEYMAGRGWWALGPTGDVYLAPQRNDYMIEVQSPGGAKLLTLTRKFTPRLRGAAEKERLADSRSMFLNGEKVRIDCEIEDHDPIIRSIHVDENRRIWVRTCLAEGQQPDDAALVYDRFDADGSFTERVRFVGIEVRRHDRLIMLSPARFILLQNVSDPAPESEAAAEPLRVLLLEAE